MANIEVYSLPAEDSHRLQWLIEQMSETGNDKAGYADVISEALKRLEIDMEPPGAKNMMRYGLIYMNDEIKRCKEGNCSSCDHSRTT